LDRLDIRESYHGCCAHLTRALGSQHLAAFQREAITVAMLEELTEEELKMELGLSQAECQVFIRSMHKHSEDV
jgi:hypothetical protein